MFKFARFYCKLASITYKIYVLKQFVFLFLLSFHVLLMIFNFDND